MCYLPTFVLEVIDWVMKRATADRPRGITHSLMKKLEDEDFADDIALLSHNLKDIQEKTARVETAAAHVGLKISHAKSKIVKMNGRAEGHVQARGQDLEEVSALKYLGSYLTADGNIEKEINSRIA